jgi:hypothetical protein
MGSGKKVTIGYKYYMGLHMGLCRGPINELVRIDVGDKTAWEGSATGNTEFKIDKGGLFGGDKKEGGIVGPLALLMGAPDQPIHARLAAMLGGLVPAFRGLCTVFFDGEVCAMSPYPKPWKFRVRRSTAGWEGGTAWYPERALIQLDDGGAIHAMNPAHILYQIYTDSRMGRGLPSSRLDAAAFKAMADALWTEKFGICITWARKDSIEGFAQTIIDHVGAVIFVDRTTGLLKPVLIRNDYNPATLPLYTPETGLLGIDEDEIAAVANASNEICVKYVSPLDGKDRQARVQNRAAINSSGRVISETNEYPGIPTRALALRVAARDLKASSGNLRKMKLRLDRRGAEIMPGGVFRISEPTRGIENMVLRAGRCEYGEGTDGTVTIDAVQDVFGLPATVYVGQETSGYVPPDLTPKSPPLQRLVEIPYRDIAASLGQAEAEAMDVYSGYVAAIATKPTPMSMGFELWTSPGGWHRAAEDTGAFCPASPIAAAMDVTTASVTLTDKTGLEDVATGSVAMIDNEIVRIDAIDAASGVLTLARGCVDSVPASHAAGAILWLYDGAGGIDETEYVQSTSVSARLLTVTSGGILALASASTISTQIAARAGRPYPPGQFRVNGQAYPATISGNLTVSWSHRDRITQADLLIDTNQASIGPEAGVTYRLRIYGNGSLRRTLPDLSGTSYTYAAADEITDGGPFTTLRIVLDAVRDGIYSSQAHDWTVSR